jgi:hypothetical protein
MDHLTRHNKLVKLETVQARIVAAKEDSGWPKYNERSVLAEECRELMEELDILPLPADEARRIRENILAWCDFSADDYAEPGYSKDDPDAVLAFADWNVHDGRSGHTNRVWTTEGNLLECDYNFSDRTAMACGLLPGMELADVGVEEGWSDQWTTCGVCGRAVRTEADCYSWTASYYSDEETGDVTCHECIQDDPESYLQHAVNKLRNANLVDPEAHGFIHVTRDSHGGSWEHGLHEHMADSPEGHLKVLNDGGFDVLFKVSSSQFYVSWTIYVRPMDPDGELDFSDASYTDEIRSVIVEQVRELIETCGECKLSPTPAELCRRALQQVDLRRPEKVPAGSVVVSTVNVGDGTAQTKIVDREDFIDGDF